MPMTALKKAAKVCGLQAGLLGATLLGITYIAVGPDMAPEGKTLFWVAAHAYGLALLMIAAYKASDR